MATAGLSVQALASGSEVQLWASGLPDECVICCEQFTPASIVRRLCCGHAYHLPCIDRWCSTRTCCPLCKLDLGKTSAAPFTDALHTLLDVALENVPAEGASAALWLEVRSLSGERSLARARMVPVGGVPAFTSNARLAL